MRTLAMTSMFASLLVAACATRQTAWTTLTAAEVPEGSDAFVLVREMAMHLTDVEHDRGHLRGRVARAWLLPPAGVVAIADNMRTSTPAQIARSAGWPELQLAGRVVDLPHADIRSVRATVDVEPDGDAEAEAEAEAEASYGADNPPLLITAAMSLLEYMVDPCCARCRRRW